MWSAPGYRQLPTCLGVISKHITQGWGRLNFNGFIFGEVGNRSLSDKPNGPDRHLCQLRGLVLSGDHSGDKLRNRGHTGACPDHMRHQAHVTYSSVLSADTPHVLFQAWTSLNDTVCRGQGRLSLASQYNTKTKSSPGGVLPVPVKTKNQFRGQILR